MTDEEYLFHQDVRQKKRTSYGAFHKKNGSRSKKCNFPSDYMTKKELLKMNSEPVTYDLKKFYSYDEFKALPKDIAVAYLQRLTDTYHVSARAIGSIIFGLGDTTFNAYLKSHSMDLVKWNSYTGRRAAAYCAQLKRDVEAARAEEVTEETPVDPPVKEPVVEKPRDEEQPVPKLQPRCKVLKTSMIFDGFDLEAFLFLSKRYEGQDVIVELNIHERGVENGD